MTTREQIIAAAKKADLQPYYDAQEVAIERFYSIAFDAGRVAEREECIEIVESYRVSVGNSCAGELACEWTMENLREIREAIRTRGNRK